jgi:hypothetical protein
MFEPHFDLDETHYELTKKITTDVVIPNKHFISELFLFKVILIVY